MSIVITIWNAFTIDACNKTNEQEILMIITLGTERDGLLHRQTPHKTKFAYHLRSVGQNWIRKDNDGALIFGCGPEQTSRI